MLAIIGPARNTCATRLTPEHFERMCAAARDLVAAQGIHTLASGGAAWADHVAVRLFLESAVQSTNVAEVPSATSAVRELHLYFPCEWDAARGQFRSRGHWRSDTGKAANVYHQRFSHVCAMDSLADIARALKMEGCHAHVYEGFHARNRALAAAADQLVAFAVEEHLSRGTQDTWNKFKDKPKWIVRV